MDSQTLLSEKIDITELDQLQALGTAVANILFNPKVSPTVRHRLTDLILECRESLPDEAKAEIAAIEARLILPEILKRLQ